ncbi:MAG: hypothetical protein QOH66_504 [Actinomycetota bacterium]|nr:hypothetical protein [Actinomycetota bacterium]
MRWRIASGPHPKDLLFGEGLVYRGVEGLGTHQIRAEGLLHDDPRWVNQAGGTQQLHDRARGDRRDAQIMEAPGLPTQHALGTVDGLRERLRSGVLRNVGKALFEVPYLVLGDAVPSELIAGAANKGPEPFVVERVERGAHDLALRQQTCLMQVEQPWQQLSPRQVTRGAEQDKDMRHDWGHPPWLGHVTRLNGIGHGVPFVSAARDPAFPLAPTIPWRRFGVVSVQRRRMSVSKKRCSTTEYTQGR